MSEDVMNNIVAKELSDAMEKCKQRGVDEQSLRTGLLTITIANFVHRLGMANTYALFEALPTQITSGIFDQYIDPNTNTLPMGSRPGVQTPPAYPVQQGYHNPSLPQNFIPPHHPQQPQPIQGRRRLPD